jgi:hypothetical protein
LHKPLTWVAVAVLAVGGALGLYWFQPWKIVTDKEVNESLAVVPTVAASPTASWRVFDDGDWVELGKLKGNKGDQAYAIPAGTDLDRLGSVSIWCKRFSVSFGAATLTSA